MRRKTISKLLPAILCACTLAGCGMQSKEIEEIETQSEMESIESETLEDDKTDKQPTTDIETTQKTNRLKVVVDMSQPVSVHPKNQTELDILVKMDLLDDDDTEKLLCFINELLAKDKYEGRRESAIEYLAE